MGQGKVVAVAESRRFAGEILDQLEKKTGKPHYIEVNFSQCEVGMCQSSVIEMPWCKIGAEIDIESEENSWHKAQECA